MSSFVSDFLHSVSCQWDSPMVCVRLQSHGPPGFIPWYPVVRIRHDSPVLLLMASVRFPVWSHCGASTGAAINILVNVFARHYICISVGYIYLRMELLGHGIHVCSVWTLPDNLPKWFTNLHSHQRCKRVPVAPRPGQLLLLVMFFISVILGTCGGIALWF